MPEIDQRECDMMEPETIGGFAFKTDQQGLEFVNPCECSLTHKASLVHFTIKMPFTSTFHAFSIPLVFRNVRDDTTIPQQLPCCTCVKTTISIKEGTFIIQPTALHIFEDVLQFLFEVKAVIMVPSDNTCRRDNRTMRISYWQDIAGYGLLSALISDAFAPFLAALWLPSRLSSDKFNSPRMEIILASKSRWRLPSLLHLRK